MTNGCKRGWWPSLPRAEDDDADVRRFLGRVLIVVAVAAAIAAALAGVPDPLPGVALEAPALWHVEVFGAIVVVLYLVVAVIALSFHGWLPTKIDTPAGGAGTAPVTEQSNAISEQTRAIEELTDTVTAGFADIDGRLTAIARRLDIKVDTAAGGDDRG